MSQILCTMIIMRGFRASSSVDTSGSPNWESPGSIHMYSPAPKVAKKKKKKEKEKENKIVMRGAVSRFTYHCILKSDSSENVHLS